MKQNMEFVNNSSENECVCVLIEFVLMNEHFKIKHIL